MTQNPTAEAINIFLEIRKALDKHIKDNNTREEIKRSIRTRSRELPAMMLDLGLIPTLSYILAKSGLDNLIKAVELIKNSKQVEEIDKEDFSYAIYAYTILEYLHKHLKPKELQAPLKDYIADKNKLTDLLEQHLRHLASGVNPQITLTLLKPYLEQFKRLCEAEFPAK